MNDIDTVKHLKRFYDTSLYSLGYRFMFSGPRLRTLSDIFPYSVKKFREWRKGWGFQSGRSQQWSDEQLMGMVDEIKPRYPEIGARRLVDLLRTRYQVKVPE